MGMGNIVRVAFNLVSLCLCLSVSLVVCVRARGRACACVCVCVPHSFIYCFVRICFVLICNETL